MACNAARKAITHYHARGCWHTVTGPAGKRRVQCVGQNTPPGGAGRHVRSGRSRAGVTPMSGTWAPTAGVPLARDWRDGDGRARGPPCWRPPPCPLSCHDISQPAPLHQIHHINTAAPGKAPRPGTAPPPARGPLLYCGPINLNRPNRAPVPKVRRARRPTGARSRNISAAPPARPGPRVRHCNRLRTAAIVTWQGGQGGPGTGGRDPGPARPGPAGAGPMQGGGRPGPGRPCAPGA